MTAITSIDSLSDINAGPVQLGGELQVQADRRQQTGKQMTNFAGWCVMTYGSTDNVYNNINLQLGGNYLNDQCWTTSVDSPCQLVYGNNSSTDAMEVDFCNATAQKTNTAKLAQESGIGNNDNSSVQNFNYALWSAGNLNFVANQNAVGVTPGSVSADLTQPAFGSKWNSSYTINNVDLTTANTNSFSANIFNQMMATNGQWMSDQQRAQLSGITNSTDFYNQAINVCRSTLFQMPT